MIKHRQGLQLTGHGKDRRWRRMNRFSDREISSDGLERRAGRNDKFLIGRQLQKDRKVGGALITGGMGTYGALLGTMAAKAVDTAPEKIAVGAGMTAIGAGMGYGLTKALFNQQNNDFNTVAEKLGNTEKRPLVLTDRAHMNIVMGKHLMKHGQTMEEKLSGAQAYEMGMQEKARRKMINEERKARGLAPKYL